MSGAHYTINQAVNTPATGTEDEARTDLWQNRQVHFIAESNDGQVVFQWTVLAWPVNDLDQDQFTNANGDDAVFIPETPGTYRVELVVDDGIGANRREFIFAVTRDTNGILIDNGYREPAFGENEGDDTSEGNERGWALSTDRAMGGLCPTVPAATDLRDRIGYRFKQMHTNGGDAQGDGLGGLFFFDIFSTTADDGLDVFQPGFGTGGALAEGRWHRATSRPSDPYYQTMSSPNGGVVVDLPQRAKLKHLGGYQVYSDDDATTTTIGPRMWENRVANDESEIIVDPALENSDILIEGQEEGVCVVRVKNPPEQFAGWPVMIAQHSTSIIDVEVEDFDFPGITLATLGTNVDEPHWVELSYLSAVDGWENIRQGSISGGDGAPGSPGVDGDFGGALTFQYQYSTTTTDSDPGNGILRFNNTTLSSATQIYTDLLDNLGNAITAVLDSFSLDGSAMHLRVEKKGSPTNFVLYLVTARTTATGYRKFTLTYLADGGTLANNDIVLAQWTQDGASGSSLENLQTFSSGSGTWTKPSGAYKISVISNWGGGGGGCSGAGGDGITSSTLGGPGGGGGAFDQIIIPTTLLGGTESYAVGAGGAGGAGNTFDANSNIGADGGTSTFGNWSQACGGKGGTTAANGKGGPGGGVLQVGGVTANIGGGANAVDAFGTGHEGGGINAASAAPGKAAVYGGAGGGNNATSSVTAGAGGRSMHGGGGGGAGGNSGGTGNASLAGGAGGGSGVGSISGGGGAGGASVGTGVDGLAGATPTATPGRGGAGGGGGSGSNGTGALRLGGAGAAGAAPGGGGGGGGAANSGGSAGRGAAGGSGADGRIVVHSIG